MISRIELNESDRARVEQYRRALAKTRQEFAAGGLDAPLLARLLGRMEAVTEGLLDIVDPPEGQR